jgi:hypothetical protein
MRLTGFCACGTRLWQVVQLGLLAACVNRAEAAAAVDGQALQRYEASHAPPGSLHDGLWYVSERNVAEMLIDDCVDRVSGRTRHPWNTSRKPDPFTHLCLASFARTPDRRSDGNPTTPVVRGG